MDAAWIGVIGTLAGSSVGLLAAWLNRRSDTKEREIDRSRAERNRELDRAERVDLHWLDRKHAVYVDFLSAVDQHSKALDERMNPAGTGTFLSTGTRLRFHPGLFPDTSQAALQEAFEALQIVAQQPVADLAFKTMVALHVRDQRNEWRTDASNRDDTGALNSMSRKAEAARLEVEERLAQLRTAIREDLGTGGRLDLSAEIPT